MFPSQTYCLTPTKPRAKPVRRSGPILVPSTYSSEASRPAPAGLALSFPSVISPLTAIRWAVSEVQFGTSFQSRSNSMPAMLGGHNLVR